MKISDLLCQYLYQNKELVMEGFGVFQLDPSVNPLDIKEPQQIYQGITFQNNHKVKTTPEVIDFLVQHSGKMRPLAISDLDAFLTTGRELLNIGKPLILNGIGTLTGYKADALDFTPGPFVPMRLDSLAGQFRERVATSENEMFRTEDNAGASEASHAQNRRLLLLVAGILLLLLAGWGIYHFAFKKQGGTASDNATQIQPVEQQEAPVAKKDTTAVTQAADKPDSAASPPVNKLSASPTHTQGTTVITAPVSCKVVIQSFDDPAKAQKRYDSLRNWGHNVALETRDSTHIYLLMPFSAPLSDTTVIKDSLSGFFGHPVHVRISH
jgi:hypothetical protein